MPNKRNNVNKQPIEWKIASPTFNKLMIKGYTQARQTVTRKQIIWSKKKSKTYVGILF